MASSIETANSRIRSVDVLRGAIMIIMAIDHVRVFSGIPIASTSLPIFFTRWITHYCAPGFAFLAGASAFLYLQQSGSRKDVRYFLITRGLFLVVLEITMIRFLWTFDVNPTDFVHTNIIWTLGWCMIILSLCVGRNPTVVAAIGIVIIAGQQAFQYIPHLFPDQARTLACTWSFIYPSADCAWSKTAVLPGMALPKMYGVTILYTIIPWIGVVMAGYGFGQVLLMEPKRRNKVCIRLGMIMIGVFVAIASVIAVGMSTDIPFLIRLLGQQKYPPTQLYLLMTLGPLIILVPAAQKARGEISDIVSRLGRVPMFYYIVHLLLIHVSAVSINYLFTGSSQNQWYVTSPLVSVAENDRWPLGIVYLVWAFNVIVLLMICELYSHYKQSHPEKKWLRYL